MNEQPTHLDLFSGIGGFALAAGWAGFKTIGFCEIDPYCQAVLKKHWPQTPIHSDIRELRGGAYGNCTLLTGGFPCQPFSHAGKRRGKNDDRHLWPEMLRVIEEAKPAWIIGENVAGIINMELDQVCFDLEAKGYEVQPLIIPACAVDAPHRRDRVWILANSNNSRGCGRKHGYPKSKRSASRESISNSRDMEYGWIMANPSRSRQSGHQRVGATSAEGLPGGHLAECCSHGGGENVADPKSKQGSSENYGGKQGKTCEPEQGKFGGNYCWEFRPCNWPTEPRLGRVANGIPNRAHRLKGLGNAIVPQVAYQIIKGIRELL